MIAETSVEVERLWAHLTQTYSGSSVTVEARPDGTYRVLVDGADAGEYTATKDGADFRLRRVL